MDTKIGGARGAIRGFVLAQLETRGVSQVEDDTSLLESGVADSLGIFQLVAFLEQAFRIHVGDHEISHDNFGSIDALVRFVDSKLASPPA